MGRRHDAAEEVHGHTHLVTIHPWQVQAVANLIYPLQNAILEAAGRDQGPEENRVGNRLHRQLAAVARKRLSS